MSHVLHTSAGLGQRGIGAAPRAGPARAFRLSALAFGVPVAALALALPGAGLWPLAAALAVHAGAATLAHRALRRGYPHDRLGLCNLVTLGRLALVSALVAPLLAAPGPSWAIVALAAAALALDGADGWLARRQRLVSEFGARFDMEVDAALALVLALNAALGSGAGLAALALGLPRYAFVAAGMILPWLRGDLPPRFSRKAVCVLQLAVLVALQAPILPTQVALAAGLVAAAALAWSFGLDIRWLWRARA